MPGRATQMCCIQTASHAHSSPVSFASSFDEKGFTSGGGTAQAANEMMLVEENASMTECKCQVMRPPPFTHAAATAAAAAVTAAVAAASSLPALALQCFSPHGSSAPPPFNLGNNRSSLTHPGTPLAKHQQGQKEIKATATSNSVKDNREPACFRVVLPMMREMQQRSASGGGGGLMLYSRKELPMMMRLGREGEEARG